MNNSPVIEITCGINVSYAPDGTRIETDGCAKPQHAAPSGEVSSYASIVATQQGLNHQLAAGRQAIAARQAILQQQHHQLTVMTHQLNHAKNAAFNAKIRASPHFGTNALMIAGARAEADQKAKQDIAELERQLGEQNRLEEQARKNTN